MLVIMVGAYIYVRATFGRFWGWITGFMQYIILPSTVIGGIISMFRINLNQLSFFLDYLIDDLIYLLIV